MIEEYSRKYCRVCAGDIASDAQTCPLCSSLQQPEKRFRSIGFSIIIAIAGFFGIMLLGIMSAHAIQQFIGIRTETFNASALKNIKSAKNDLDLFIYDNEKFPETFNELHFKPETGVTVLLEKTADKKYKLISYHAQGDKEYLAVSGQSEIFYKKKYQSGWRNFIQDLIGSK